MFGGSRRIAHLLSCVLGAPLAQRTWQIWSFAFAFAVRYFALKLRFTYGRAGMTPEAVISRRSKLAAWLREGLVKLGPTFIKIGERGLELT
jgi:predicted unusual protein kinase regulating ubiquinone biosynthesis (AarF/ABC1/UbiB family)